MEDINPTKEKVSIIAKELDTGFQVFNRMAIQLSTMHGWTLTLVFAYMTFLVSIKARNAWVLLPLAIFLILLMYLEAGHRRDMHSVRTSICKVEHIFMETDPVKFIKLVKEYEFRDIRVQTKPRPGPLQYLIGSKVKMKVFRWYFLLFFLASAVYVGISRSLFQ